MEKKKEYKLRVGKNHICLTQSPILGIWPLCLVYSRPSMSLEGERTINVNVQTRHLETEALRTKNKAFRFTGEFMNSPQFFFPLDFFEYSFFSPIMIYLSPDLSSRSILQRYLWKTIAFCFGVQFSCG